MVVVVGIVVDVVLVVDVVVLVEVEVVVAVVAVVVVDVVVDVVVVVGGTGHAENSDVSLVMRSVAVAVSSVAPIVWPKLTVKPTSPFPSVVPVSTVPTKVLPSPLPRRIALVIREDLDAEGAAGPRVEPR